MIRTLEEHRKKVEDLTRRLSGLIWKVVNAVCTSRTDIIPLEVGLGVNCLYRTIMYKDTEYEENELLPIDVIASILKPENFEKLISFVFDKSILKQLKEFLLKDAEIIDRLL